MGYNKFIRVGIIDMEKIFIFQCNAYQAAGSKMVKKFLLFQQSS